MMKKVDNMNEQMENFNRYEKSQIEMLEIKNK
jgi:hypothetical protein